MADNFFTIPLINPVKFYDVDRANLDKYFTKHFDDYPFDERLYDWHEPDEYVQPWQTTDIIKLQFESTFDPIIVELVDRFGIAQITLPALVGLPNKYYANTFSFEIAMSLASVTTGCYRLKLTAGSAGPSQKVYLSGRQYITATPFTYPTLMMEYWHSRFHEDVIFETGIKFQYRLLGHLGFLSPGRDDEKTKDQRYNPTILSSRSFRKQDVFFGDDFGLPDDVIDLLNRIWGCNNVYIDNKSFAANDGDFEYFDVTHQKYPRRGVKLTVEEGINRRSAIFSVETDTTKKLVYGIVVEAKVWGDTSNQGSSNTVPIITVE
jgi:hypothetical protein